MGKFGGESSVYSGDVCGIDISAKELVVLVRRGGQAEPVRRFANTSAGQAELQEYVTSAGTRVRVCLESTGLYGLDVALRLQADAGLEIMVANRSTPCLLPEFVIPKGFSPEESVVARTVRKRVCWEGIPDCSYNENQQQIPHDRAVRNDKL